ARADAAPARHEQTLPPLGTSRRCPRSARADAAPARHEQTLPAARHEQTLTPLGGGTLTPPGTNRS
ncbi:hypothetical protein, partial [Kribbella pratensis]|uniref:hypothetical protein n=1 Tax=Kribbella pratensis TaxID=2512112 RepID=UPI001EE0EF72